MRSHQNGQKPSRPYLDMVSRRKGLATEQGFKAFVKGRPSSGVRLSCFHAALAHFGNRTPARDHKLHKWVSIAYSLCFFGTHTVTCPTVVANAASSAWRLWVSVSFVTLRIPCLSVLELSRIVTLKNLCPMQRQKELKVLTVKSFEDSKLTGKLEVAMMSVQDHESQDGIFPSLPTLRSVFLHHIDIAHLFCYGCPKFR